MEIHDRVRLWITHESKLLMSPIKVSLFLFFLPLIPFSTWKTRFVSIQSTRNRSFFISFPLLSGVINILFILSPPKKRRKTKWERNFFFWLFASLFCLLRSSSVNKYCRGDWRHTRRWLDHKRERPGGGCGRSLKGRGEVIRRCVLTTRFTSTSNGKQPLCSVRILHCIFSLPPLVPCYFIISFFFLLSTKELKKKIPLLPVGISAFASFAIRVPITLSFPSSFFPFFTWCRENKADGKRSGDLRVIEAKGDCQR